MTTAETDAQSATAGSMAKGVAVVLGVGPGLGLAVARRFGRGGHPVAVVSRSDARHGGYLELLRADGASAIAAAAG